MAAGEGQQIMALISKRLRALRKRHNRIAGFEESVAQGKTLNKDQEEIVRSKPIVTALIQELEKLRLPSSPPPPPEASVPKQICLCLPVHPTQSMSEEMANEEEVMMSKTDCKISDDLNDGEVSKDEVETVNDTTSSACCSSESSQGVTPSPTSEKVEDEEGWTEVVRRRKRAPAPTPPPPARGRGRGRQGPSSRKPYNRQSKQRPASN